MALLNTDDTTIERLDSPDNSDLSIVMGPPVTDDDDDDNNASDSNLSIVMQPNATEEYVPDSLSTIVDRKAQAKLPQKSPKEFSAGELFGDIAGAIPYGVVEGALETFDTVSAMAEGASEFITGRELWDTEDTVNPFNPPVTIPGQIVGGLSQFAPGFIPAVGTTGVVINVSSGLFNLSRSSYKLFKHDAVRNYLKETGEYVSKNIVDIASNNPTFMKWAKRIGAIGAAGTTAGIAEMYAFDPRDPRLADFAAQADIPGISDMAKLLAQNPDDTELHLYTKMFVEGFGLGAALDLALIGIKGSLAGLKKSEALKESPKITKQDIMEMAVKLDGVSPATKEGAARILAVYKKAFSHMPEDYLTKYVGSINTDHLLSGKLETFNLLKETADAIKLSDPNNWQKTITNKETLKEAATLMGHDSIESMEAVLSKTQGMLALSRNAEGNVVVGAGLENVSAYAVAARQQLLLSQDVLFGLAKEIKAMKGETASPTTVDDIATLKAAFVQQLLVYQKVQDTVNSVSGEAGRLLQSFNINVGEGIKPSFINDMINSTGGNLDDLIGNLSASTTKDVVERHNALFNAPKNKTLIQKIQGAIGEYWYNSILSAIDTNVINTAGNVSVQLARTFIEGGIGAARGEGKRLTARLTGKEIDPSEVMLLGDVWQRVRGILSGYTSGSVVRKRGKDALRVSLAGKENPMVLDRMLADVVASGKKLDEVFTSVGAFNTLYKETKDRMVDEYAASVVSGMKTVRLFANTFKHEMPADIRYSTYEAFELGADQKNIDIPVVGRIIRTPTTLMTAMDVAFKSVADNAALYEAAYREIRGMKYMASKNPDGKIVLPDGREVVYKKGMFTIPGEGGDETFVAAEMLEYLRANPTKSMEEYARKEFLEATFQQQGTATEVGEGVRRFLNNPFRVMPEGVSTGVGTVLMPFVRTPINLIAYALGRTPLGLLSKEVRDARKVVKELNSKKSLTATQRNQLRDSKIIIEKSYNKQVAGATYLTMAGFAASSGMITGGGPKDYAARQRLSATGWRPYSIKIKGEYYPISRLDPFSQLAAFAADLNHAASDLAQADMSEEDRREAGQRLLFITNNLVSGMGKMITEKTYLKAMGEIGEAIFAPTTDTGSGLLKDKTAQVASRVMGSVVGGLVPNIVSRTGEAFYDEEPSKKDGLLPVALFHDPYIRDLYADMGFWRTFVAKATAKVSGVRPYVADDYFPRFNHFGYPIQKDAMPFDNEDISGRLLNMTLTVTRRGGSPLTMKEKEAVLVEQAYRTKPLRVDKRYKFPGTNFKVDLTPELFAERSKLQGRLYRNYIMDQLNNNNKVRALRNSAESHPNKSKRQHRVYRLGQVISHLQNQAKKNATGLLLHKHRYKLEELLKEQGHSLGRVTALEYSEKLDPYPFKFWPLSD